MTERYLGDDQMYVQQWRSGAVTHSTPVILVHGGAHTGSCWTTRPDGGPGWAKLLADNGFAAHVVDWPGSGRSPRKDDFLDQGASPITRALAELIDELGGAVVIGHSIGFPLALKAVEQATASVQAIVGVAPSAPGNVASASGLSPTDRPVRIGPEQARRYFTDSPRFPTEWEAEYLRSLCDYSGRVANACGDRDGSGTLVIHDLERVRAIPSLMIGARGDRLTRLDAVLAIAAFLGAEHVALEDEWSLTGFGHLMPVENGTEQIVARLVDWIRAYVAPEDRKPTVSAS